MATKKSKSSKKSAKTPTTKPKTAKKTVKTKTVEKVEKTAKPVAVAAKPSAKKSCLSGFFAKKYEEKESILTVFKCHKFYGALIGELLGTMVLALVLFSLSLMGIANIATYAIAVIAILIAIYGFSGACLNPLVVVGMMASRRMSVIRGIMYIIAEVIGAWFAWLIFNGFHLAGGETAYDAPAMATLAEGGFWVVAIVEIVGAIIIAFFFNRALRYKRSVFTFAATAAGGMVLAILIGYVVSAAFLGLNNNFIFNPAAALMLKIFPEAGESFGEVF